MKRIGCFIFGLCLLFCLLGISSGPLRAAGTVPGDVNNDGVFNAQDLNLALEAFLKGNPSLLIRPDLGDVAPDPSAFPQGFGDGLILSDDINRLFRALTGIQPLRTLPDINLNDVTVGKDLQEGISFSLGTPAPAGGQTVTIQVADSSKARLSTDPAVLGDASGSISFLIAEKDTFTPPFYVQALAGSGTVSYTASAPGYFSATKTINLYPSGFGEFTFGGSGGFTTTPFSPDSPLSIYPIALNPGTLSYYTTQSLRAGLGPISVAITSDTPAVGTITTSPVVFNSGDGFQLSSFHPKTSGSSVIQVISPDGFSTPSDYQTETATVAAPGINLSDITVGKDLQTQVVISLGIPAPAGGKTVTIKVADSTKVRLSTDPAVLGGESVSFTLDEGEFFTPSFYIQALVGTGTVSYTASAPGYTSATHTITFVPSGFVNLLTQGADPNFSTTLLSSDTNVPIYPAALYADSLSFFTAQPLRAGIGPISVTITSDTPSVGSIITSPVVLHSGDSFQNTAFHPQSEGTTVIRVHTPDGFTTPSDNQNVTANVTAPNLNLSDITVGKDLQEITSFTLEAPVQAGGKTLTIQVADATKARLSTDPAVLGGASISLTLNEGDKFTPNFFVQALVGTGTVSYTASAPGYQTVTKTINLYPSGFINNQLGGGSDSFNTTATASDTFFPINLVALDPVTFAPFANQSLRAGAGPINVTVTSDNPAVGTLTTSPVVINSGDSYQYTSFHPLSAGTTVIRIQTPSGFITPNDFQNVTVNVGN